LIGIEYDKNKVNSEQVLSNIPANLSGSVGQGGKNESMDVYAVQILLARNDFKVLADGLVNTEMETIIQEFQQAQGIEATGLVEPSSDTWNALNGKPVIPS